MGNLDKESGKGRRSLYEMDGVKIESGELQSYITSVRCYEYSYEGRKPFKSVSIHIPLGIARLLALQTGDKILVAIRRASDDDLREYNMIRAKCPSCRAYVTWDGALYSCKRCSWQGHDALILDGDGKVRF